MNDFSPAPDSTRTFRPCLISSLTLPGVAATRVSNLFFSLGFAIITASTPAASAVLKIAPIFPGFSGDSATRSKGFFGRINLFKLNLDL